MSKQTSYIIMKTHIAQVSSAIFLGWVGSCLFISCLTFSFYFAWFSYSQTCFKRSPLGQRKKWPYKTGDLLKEVQFILNLLWKDKKKVTF